MLPTHNIREGDKERERGRHHYCQNDCGLDRVDDEGFHGRVLLSKFDFRVSDDIVITCGYHKGKSGFQKKSKKAKIIRKRLPVVSKRRYNYLADNLLCQQNVDMANKPKKAKKMPRTAELEPPPVAQSEDRHKYPLWGLRLPPRYKAAMKKVAQKSRRLTTEEVKIALENHYLAVMGEPLPFGFDTITEEK